MDDRELSQRLTIIEQTLYQIQQTLNTTTKRQEPEDEEELTQEDYKKGKEIQDEEQENEPTRKTKKVRIRDRQIEG